MYHILIVLYSKYVIFIHVMFSSTDSEGLPGRCVPANTRRDSGRYSSLRDTGPFLRPRHAASSGRPRWQRGGTLDESQTIFNGSSVDTAYMGTTYLLKYFYPHFQHQLKTFKTLKF